MKHCAFLVVVLWATHSMAEVPKSQAAQTQHAAAAQAQHPAGNGTPKGVEPNNLAGLPQTVPDQEKVQELTHRVQILEVQMVQRSKQSEADKNTAIVTAIIAAAAVLGAAIIGAVLGFASQWFGARRAAKLAGDEAMYRNAEHILEFRMKQVQEFYAPMHALLRQSRDLYDKMLEQLVQDEPTRYRKVATATGTEFRWEVMDKKGAWRGFRLLDQFPAIKGNAKALALADANLTIGGKICEVISTRAGYASESLVEMLGQYMAHFAILSSVRSGSEAEPYEPGWHKVGYFPFGLDQKIGEAYHDLSKSIDEYGRACTHTLEALAKTSQ